TGSASRCQGPLLAGRTFLLSAKASNQGTNIPPFVKGGGGGISADTRAIRADDTVVQTTQGSVFCGWAPCCRNMQVQRSGGRCASPPKSPCIPLYERGRRRACRPAQDQLVAAKGLS